MYAKPYMGKFKLHRQIPFHGLSVVLRKNPNFILFNEDGSEMRSGAHEATPELSFLVRQMDKPFIATADTPEECKGWVDTIENTIVAWHEKQLMQEEKFRKDSRWTVKETAEKKEEEQKRHRVATQTKEQENQEKQMEGHPLC